MAFGFLPPKPTLSSAGGRETLIASRVSDTSVANADLPTVLACEARARAAFWRQMPWRSWSSRRRSGPSKRFSVPGFGSANLVPRKSCLRTLRRKSCLFPVAASTPKLTRRMAAVPQRPQKRRSVSVSTAKQASHLKAQRLVRRTTMPSNETKRSPICRSTFCIAKSAVAQEAPWTTTMAASASPLSRGVNRDPLALADSKLSPPSQPTPSSSSAVPTATPPPPLLRMRDDVET
mmetsp:Transcript_18415/g.62072  ORF Transcript_18415/g.62072 Transcript_18415/m.62072 type:complete len:234 (-) Transcript_18415:295-996(-)